MKIKSAFLFAASFILLIGTNNLKAQDSAWSIEDCINYALDHNIDIKKQFLSVEGYEADLLQSKLGMLPTLNGGATHGYNWGQAIDRYTNEFASTRVQSNNFYIGSDLNLFTGLRQLNTIEQNKLELAASQYDLDLMMDNISLAVAGFYLDILYNEELLAVAREQLSVTQQQVDRMQKMVDAGTMSRGDLLNLQAQAATEELQVVDAENNLAISNLNLMQLIDLPVTSDFQVEKPEMRDVKAPGLGITAIDIYNTALGLRPEVKSAELRVQSAEKSISIARGWQSPVLAFNGMWATGYSGAQAQGVGETTKTSVIGYTDEENSVPVVTQYTDYTSYETIPFNDQFSDNNNRSVGLSLQIPIFNGWQVRTAISKAKIQHETAENTLQQTKLNLNKTIQQAYLDAVSALKNFDAAEKKVEAQREAFKYAGQRLDVGMLTSVEYNQVKKDLTLAESQLLQSKYRFIYTTTVLQFYMGQPISFK
jgi:outer membrane protein